jgi:hypothetical protein
VARVETAKPVGLPLAERKFDSAKVVITVPVQGGRQAWDEVRDIVGRAGGRVLTGRPMDDLPAKSRASELMAIRPSRSALDEVVIQVPRRRVECTVRRLASSHLRAVVSDAGCRPENGRSDLPVRRHGGPERNEVRVRLPLIEGTSATAALPEPSPTATREVFAVAKGTQESPVDRVDGQLSCAVELGPRLGASLTSAEAHH